MPAYNFKDEFVPKIVNGTKRTTIRQVRKKRPTRVGDRLFLFNRMRQCKCRLIKDTTCIKLTPIEIRVSAKHGVKVTLDGQAMRQPAIKQLAINDGFKSVTDFGLFFLKTYGATFVGELIEWEA